LRRNGRRLEGRRWLRSWRQVLRRCAWRVFEDRLLGKAAAVAFYALMAVFSALAALITFCGFFVNADAAARTLQPVACCPPGRPRWRGTRWSG